MEKRNADIPKLGPSARGSPQSLLEWFAARTLERSQEEQRHCRSHVQNAFAASATLAMRYDKECGKKLLCLWRLIASRHNSIPTRKAEAA